MEVQEFGQENSRKIVLVPGNMMSWRQFEGVIPLLEKDFHVVAVSMDGYDGKAIPYPCNYKTACRGAGCFCLFIGSFRGKDRRRRL